jgi:hypothetical protein
MTGYQLLQKMQQMNVYDLAGDIIANNEQKVADINRRQLHKGLNREGKQLSPKYSEDPWFKSAESAARYAAWKKSLFPDMTYDVPNLIITGVYHDSINLQRMGQSIQFDASASFAAGIAGKYQNTALGLNDEGKGEVWTTIVRAPLIEITKEKTGFK